jgi:hypothetical protein
MRISVTSPARFGHVQHIITSGFEIIGERLPIIAVIGRILGYPNKI